MPLNADNFDSASSHPGYQGLLDDSYRDSDSSVRGPGSIFTGALTDSDLQSENCFDDQYRPLPPYYQDHSNTRDFAFSSYHAQDAMSVAAPHTTSSWLHNSYNPLSPSSAEHTMISRTDNSFISHNLLHVYHDVFEHSLSCWVSEESCPYKMPARNRTGHLGMTISRRVNVPQQEGGLAQREWGSVWSNRIYSRVIRLDRVAQACNMIQLTRSEDQAVAKALHLAIMAFSSQWAHQSHREREKFPPGFTSENQDLNFSDDLTEEFDRQIQRTFWEQARKALLDCADVECYRVVCAELIFGLTQKPWEKDDPIDLASSISPGFEPGTYDMKASAMAAVHRILSKDGPPVFIERAARKVHALKFRLDAVEMGLAKAKREHGDAYKPDSRTTISTRDRETAGFVHWLAVMFDTISSSMNQRPVVVIDEDCQHDAAGEASLAESDLNKGKTALRIKRWSINHFIQDDPNGPMQPLRWPCDYEDAARAVTRSGPVKILLHRHVSYLQDAIRRGQHGESIEEIIRNSVLVYRYWNATYGVFFRDLIDHYATVPPRIQSWFFCILGHWHLAALILADLIESVDHNGQGDPRARQERLSSTTVDTIRRVSSSELADLARVTTPPDWAEWMNPPSPQLPDFHTAVNQGAILTEPWTVVLIRAFTKAFIWHLGEAEMWQHNRASLGHGRQYCQESHKRCMEIVRALWYLGKKSDMARNIARALSKSMAVLNERNNT